MDELLRKYARQRREGAKFELHPATRNMLQDEVKRVYAAKPGGGENRTSNWIVMFWPHLAAAMVVALLLAISIGLFRPEDPKLAADTRSMAPGQNDNLPEKELSRLDSQAEKKELFFENAEAKAESGLARKPGTPVETELFQEKAFKDEAAGNRGFGVDLTGEKKDQTKEKAVQLQTRVTPSPAAPKPTLQPFNKLTVIPEEIERIPATANTDPEGKLQEIKRERLLLATDAARRVETDSVPGLVKGVQEQPLEPAVTLPTATARSVADMEKIENLGAALRRDFVAVTNGTTVGAAAATSVWAATFRMEQLGQQVLFSNNGSTYVGNLQQAPAGPNDYFALEARSRGLRFAESGTNAPTPAGNIGYYFKATGLNRTLGKNMVFEGQLFEPTNKADLTIAAKAAAARPSTASRAPQRLGTVPTIVGRVLVDGTNLLPVQAVSPEK
jgi:hypothetical protein